MPSNSEDFAVSRRFTEVDDAMRNLNIAMAVVVAGSAALFLPRFGLGFSLFASLPLLYWAFRLSPAKSLLGLPGWNMILVVVMTTSVGGGAVTSGGADSPVVFFTGVIALFGHAIFPKPKIYAGAGVVSILAIALGDLAIGRSIDPFILLCALVIAAYLPVFIDRMVVLENRQRRRAVVDQLTGCLNRHALDLRATELEEQGRRTQSCLSVVMFDLDHFKQVNDVHGHAQGDRVLEHVSYITRKYLRRFELMYRLGGEEFAILLPGADLGIASGMAERIRAGIESSPMDAIRVTASFGVACRDAPFDVEQTIELADHRLYDAKRAGRNCVVDHDFDAATAEV